MVISTSLHLQEQHAHSEIIGMQPDLTFLGDATDEFDTPQPCHMTGIETTRRVLLAKTY